IMASSSSNIVSSEEYQKQLSQLQYLLNIEVSTVVVEPIETSAIDTDSSSNSDNFLPLPNTEVPIISNHEIDQTCQHCKAKFWMIKKDQNSRIAAPKFSLCCTNNKVQLPPLLEPLPYLLNFYTLTNPNAVEFHKHARANFRIHGQVYHLIGSLLPNEGHILAFAQLYIYNTANEITNCQNSIHELNENVLQSLQNMLDICNPYIQNFWHARDIISDNIITEILMIICSDRNQDICYYNALTASNVAAIIVGDRYEIPRKTSATIIGRLYIVQPSKDEKYYLQALLSHVKGATSFDDLKTINDYTCSSFKEACSYLDLLQDDTK
ncbi:24213_t:CDS:2, partial [Dentiscutata erythropus]